MDNLKARKRVTKTTGEINKLRSDGFIPAVLYGGSQNNLKISLEKILLKDIIRTESFKSKVLSLDIDGKLEKALPRDVAYDALSDEPIHIDFMRVAKDSKLNLQIPVKFINSDKSPGLKKGGVLNIVRRTVELICPAENIPEEIIVDLENTEIGKSIKISSVKLPENITPTITDRDFVIATVASPTIVVEPVKAEEAVEGEGAVEGAPDEGVTDDKDKKVDEKEKSTKPTEEDSKGTKPSGEKNPAAGKETKKK